MNTQVKPIPDGMHAITLHLVCRNAVDAIAFYVCAFGVVEVREAAPYHVGFALPPTKSFRKTAMPTRIFVNLPVAELQHSAAVFTRRGFSCHGPGGHLWSSGMCNRGCV